MEIFDLFSLLSKEEKQNIIKIFESKIDTLIQIEKDKKPSMKNMVELPQYVDELIEFSKQYCGLDCKFTPPEDDRDPCDYSYGSGRYL